MDDTNKLHRIGLSAALKHKKLFLSKKNVVARLKLWVPDIEKRLFDQIRPQLIDFSLMTKSFTVTDFMKT